MVRITSIKEDHMFKVMGFNQNGQNSWISVQTHDMIVLFGLPSFTSATGKSFLRTHTATTLSGAFYRINL